MRFTGGMVNRDGGGFFSNFMVGTESPSSPSTKVEAPPGFVAPEPKPLTMTRSSDAVSILRSTISLAVRLATGAFVLGWRIDSIFAPEEDGKYALQLGPFRLRDSSSVLQDAPRPAQNLILYEYAASPFAKRVRETINVRSVWLFHFSVLHLALF